MRNLSRCENDMRAPPPLDALVDFGNPSPGPGEDRRRIEQGSLPATKFDKFFPDGSHISLEVLLPGALFAVPAREEVSRSREPVVGAFKEVVAKRDLVENDIASPTRITVAAFV
jgi:hypothetical protein